MVGLYDSPDAIFRAFTDQSHGSSQKSPVSAELNVLIRTTSVFARSDRLIASLAWNASNNGSPDRFQEQVKEGFVEIGKRVTAGQLLSNPETIDKVLETSQEIEKMVMAHEPPEKFLYPAADVDFARSNLDARVVLGDRVGNGLKIFFTVLVQQLQCCNKGHVLRLKMSGFINQVDVQSRLFFDAYLSSQYIMTPPRWVQSKCIIATDAIKTPEGNGCFFLHKAEERNQDLSLLLEDTPIQKSGDSLQQQQQEFPVSPTTKIQLDGSYPLRSPAAPTKSLWELLKLHDAGRVSGKDEDSETFYPEEREMICLNLALSLLHLSTTHWRRASWRSDRNAGEGIFFLRDPATQKIVDKTQPYLSYPLHDELNPEDDKSLSCDPQLLDFAKLIMEIHMWEILPLPPRRGDLSKKELREYLLELINDSRRFRGKDNMFKRAVKSCLDAAGKEAARDKTHKYRFHNYIFDNIVRPLDHYAEFPEFSKSTVAYAPIENSEETQDSLFDWRQENNTAKDNSSRAQDFLHNMDHFVSKHISNQTCDTSLPEHRRGKVRIAIIDSGVALDDPIIRKAREHNKIQKCRNFSSPNPEDLDDKLGHGTMVTRLLLRVAPEAELYIAKVSRNREQYIPKNKLYCIAKAITWAVQIWNVDIITMSLALQEENPDIDEALNEALDPSYGGAARKIVFVAAGNNSGGNARRSWPASKTGVIAVYVTDGLGTAVNINPSSEGDVCFATLGCGIKHTRYGEDDGDVYISGTSFATPIAAGIAANVLEYARHRVDDLNEQRKKLLYSAGCMKKIFEAMSDKRGDYYYVQPWTFWNDRIRGGGRWKNRNFPINDPDNIGLALKYIIADY